MATLAFMFTHPAVEDIGINVMAYGQRSQRYASSQILRHQFCFELRTVTPAPANLLGIVLCHYKHPLIISWVLSLAYFDGAEKMPSPDAYNQCVRPNIVFFGGPAPYYQTLYQWLAQASHPHSLFVVSGTQGNVVPIDSLLAQVEGKKVLNNLEPSPYIDEQHYAHVLYAPATEAWPQIEAFIDEHIKEHW